MLLSKFEINPDNKLLSFGLTIFPVDFSDVPKDKFNNLSAELENLTKGTVEYEEARRESNDIIRKILESNPELNSNVSYKDGLWQPDGSFW